MAKFNFNDIFSKVNEKLSGLFSSKKTQDTKKAPEIKPIGEPYAERAEAEYKKRIEAFNSDGVTATEEQEAIIFAQSVRLQFLKSPSTAKFPEISDFKVTKNEEGIYAVTGYVDAQNSYGATARDNFTVMAKKDNGKWIGLTNPLAVSYMGCLLSIAIIGITLALLSACTAFIFAM